MNWETLHCTFCRRIFHLPDQYYERVNAENYLCERCEEVSTLFSHIYALHVIGKKREEVEVIIKVLKENEATSSLSYHTVQAKLRGWSGTYWFYNGINPQLITFLHTVTSEYRLVDMTTGDIVLSFWPKTGVGPSGMFSHLLA
jgi:hypothetical protein